MTALLLLLNYSFFFNAYFIYGRRPTFELNVRQRVPSIYNILYVYLFFTKRNKN